MSRQLYEGVFDDPNGNLVPDKLMQAALYNKAGNIPPVFWEWDTSQQVWIPVITP